MNNERLAPWSGWPILDLVVSFLKFIEDPEDGSDTAHVLYFPPTAARSNANSKGVLLSRFFKDPGSFSLFVRFVWAGVNAVITLGCGPMTLQRSGLGPVLNVSGGGI